MINANPVRSAGGAFKRSPSGARTRVMAQFFGLGGTGDAVVISDRPYNNYTSITSDENFLDGYYGIVGHTVLKKGNKMYIICGLFSSTRVYTGKIWVSQDGARTWNQLSNVLYPRQNAFSIYYDGYYWVMGGRNFLLHRGDIMRSTDGITWETVVAEPVLGEKETRWGDNCYTLVNFLSKMFLFAGALSGVTEGTSPRLGVFSSQDGESWTQEATSTEIFGDELYRVAAGVVKNGYYYIVSAINSPSSEFSVHKSIDGSTWASVVESTDMFRGSDVPQLLTIGGALYFFGGKNSDGDDIVGESVDDGETWTLHEVQGNFIRGRVLR